MDTVYTSDTGDWFDESECSVSVIYAGPRKVRGQHTGGPRANRALGYILDPRACIGIVEKSTN